MIAFLCPGCGKNLKVKDELAGRKGRCPYCQKPMVVPATSGSENGSASEGRTLMPGANDTDAEQPVAAADSADNTGLKKPSPTLLGVSATPLPTPSPARGRGQGDSSAELFAFLAPAQEADEMGRLGSYRVLKVLGSGGMGVVFLAEDPKLKRLLALKILLPSLAAISANKERFLREARAVAAIEHDHIIPIYQVGEDRGVPFIAMPLLRGQSLDKRLKQEGPVPVAEALRIAQETAEGLAAAHERGLIHRDIKPANLFLEGDRGRVKILDFGLARSTRASSELTQQGTLIGTPAYMSPEQAAGKPVDTRADLFSLGCVLYHMVTGQKPFQGTDSVSVLVAVASQMPPPPRKLNPELSPRLSKLIMELLAKDPQERPPSALTVIDLLKELENEPAGEVLPIVAAPPPRAAVVRANDLTDKRPSVRADEEEDDEEFDRRPAKKSMLAPMLVGCGIAGLGLALIVGVALFLFFKKDDTPEVAQNDNPPITEQPPANNPNPPALNPQPGPKINNPPPANDGGVKNPPIKPDDDPGDILNKGRPKKEEKKSKADKTLKSYSSPVKALIFTADGKQFYSFAERNTRVDQWDRQAGKIDKSYDLGSPVQHCLLSEDGSRLIAYNDKRLLCWQISNGEPVAEVVAPPNMKIVGGGFIASKDVRAALSAKDPSGAAGVVIYDYASKKIIPRLDPRTKQPVMIRKQPVPLIFPHPSDVTQVFFGPDCKRFVSWSQDHMMRTWDLEEVRLVTTFTAAPGEQKSLAVSHDFKRILGTFHQANIRVYDVETGREVKDIKPDDFGEADAVAFGGDSTVGVASQFGGTVRVLDLESGKVKKEFQRAGAVVTAVALSPDGKTLLSGDILGSIEVYKVGE